MDVHHLFLLLCEKFPEIREAAEDKIAACLNSEAARSIKATSDLGEFLCLLSVSDKFHWRDLAEAVLKESFDRCVFWCLSKMETDMQKTMFCETQ